MHSGHSGHGYLRGHSIGQLSATVGLVRHSGERERGSHALVQNGRTFRPPNGPLFLLPP